MNICIDNMRRIEDIYLKDFELKDTLSEVEQYGLEFILTKLLYEYNLDLGQNNMDFCVDLVDTYTVHREDCLDILDGRDNILRIGDYNITSVYLTKNSIVVFHCLDWDDGCNIIDNSDYYVSLG